jgi:hypothetical protein
MGVIVSLPSPMDTVSASDSRAESLNPIRTCAPSQKGLVGRVAAAAQHRRLQFTPSMLRLDNDVSRDDVGSVGVDTQYVERIVHASSPERRWNRK